MLVTNEDYVYIVKSYTEVRFSNRGWLFKKKDPIDPRTLPGVTDYFEVGHVQGYFAERNDKKILFLMGSNEIMDWFYNFMFRFKRTPYKEAGVNRKIKVHSGFFKSYLKIRDLVHEKLRNDDRVIIYGQSFGAALATLASLDVQYNFPHKEVACITTGSPRIGNKYFANSFDGRVPETTRFVYGKDLVTTLPPKWFFYRHVHGFIHLGPEDRKLPSVTDHLMSGYIPAIVAKYGS